jgi:hypothetical protein
VEVKYVRNLIKLELGIIIIALIFATALNVQGTNITYEKAIIKNIGEKINEQTIVVPDTDIILKLWSEQIENRDILQFYSISLDGGSTIVRTVQASYELGLRYAHFDPVLESPFVENVLASGTDTHLFIVQFFTQPLE